MPSGIPHEYFPIYFDRRNNVAGSQMDLHNALKRSAALAWALHLHRLRHAS